MCICIYTYYPYIYIYIYMYILLLYIYRYLYCMYNVVKLSRHRVKTDDKQASLRLGGMCLVFDHWSVHNQELFANTMSCLTQRYVTIAIHPKKWQLSLNVGNIIALFNTTRVYQYVSVNMNDIFMNIDVIFCVLVTPSPTFGVSGLPQALFYNMSFFQMVCFGWKLMIFVNM